MIMYSSLAEWSSCANFDRSHNRFVTIFNFDPIWALLGPKRALLGPKRALLGALGAWKRPNTRSKCLVTMIPTRSDQLAAVGTKSGPPGPSGSLWGPQKVLSGPKRALLGALERSRGPLRGPSAWYGCVPSRHTVWKCFGCQSARLGRPRDSEGAKKGPGPKISFLSPWKIFNEGPSPCFYQFIIDPKVSLSCILSKIRVDVFEKSPLFCIPNFGPKRPFFGPEGPILTQNLNDIVKLVVTTENHAFQGKIWSLSDYVIFGVCRPPNTPPGPPRPPQWSRGPKMAEMHLYQSSIDN